jgi:hypothetical protein
MALAQFLLSPGTTVLTSGLAIWTTLVLVASEEKHLNMGPWLGMDAAVAACCLLYTVVFWLAGAEEYWDLLVLLVTVSNAVLDFLFFASPNGE